MKNMSLDELIEFLTDARDKGQPGSTPVVVKYGIYYRRVCSSAITNGRAAAPHIRDDRVVVDRVASRGVEVLIIG